MNPPVVRHPMPPVVNAGCRVLVLGSMPGAASLAAAHYYAHPRNQFWPILHRLFGIDPSWPYPDRLAALTGARVALWDVVASCIRPGSLDGSIDPASVVPNRVGDLLRRHRGIRAVFLNGGTADRLFRRFVLKPEPEPFREVHIELLPSTSPAHASRTLEEKLVRWRRLRDWTGTGNELPSSMPPVSPPCHPS